MNNRSLLKKLYSILDELKKSEEHEFYRTVCDFNNKFFKNQPLPLHPEFFYEEIAFAFFEKYRSSPEWGPSFYIPLTTNQWTSYPNINHLTPNTIDYWEMRSDKTDNNPILKCRYSGLVWSFSQQIRHSIPDILVAHKYINSVIKIVNSEKGFFYNKLENALKIAQTINDKSNIAFIEDSMSKYKKDAIAY